MTVAFVAVLSVHFPYSYTCGLAFFLIAAFTDYVDGALARKFSLITDFGRLMDPLVDKIMTAAAFVCLVTLRALPGWVAIIVISREFLITGLRLLAVSKGVVLPAEPIGKHKTSWQIATVVFFLGLLSAEELGLNLHQTSLHYLQTDLWLYGGWVVSGIAVILTLYSGIGYLWKHRRVVDMR